jgi:hypothetical protein
VLAALLPAAAVPAPRPSATPTSGGVPERRAEFEQPERRKVAHILVRVPAVGGSAAEEGARAKAEAALAQIKGGADFAGVAREISQDDATASRGGELGLVARGELMPPFEQVAFELKRGEVGGPVRTGYGYRDQGPRVCPPPRRSCGRWPRRSGPASQPRAAAPAPPEGGGGARATPGRSDFATGPGGEG